MFNGYLICIIEFNTLKSKNFRLRRKKGKKSSLNAFHDYKNFRLRRWKRKILASFLSIFLKIFACGADNGRKLASVFPKYLKFLPAAQKMDEIWLLKV